MAKITIESDQPFIVLPIEEYNTLMERLEVLSDTKLMQEIQEALDELETGQTADLDEFWQSEMNAG